MYLNFFFFIFSKSAATISFANDLLESKNLTNPANISSHTIPIEKIINLQNLKNIGHKLMNNNLNFKNRIKRQTYGYLDQNEDYNAREMSNISYIDNEIYKLAKKIGSLTPGDANYASSLRYLIDTLVSFNVNLGIYDIINPDNITYDKVKILIPYIKTKANLLNSKNQHKQYINEINNLKKSLKNSENYDYQKINYMTNELNLLKIKKINLEKEINEDERYIINLTDEYKKKFNN